MAYDFFCDSRFERLRPLTERAKLATPTMHGGEELVYINEAYKSGWVTTIGENINELERIAAEAIGVNHAVALTCGTAATWQSNWRLRDFISQVRESALRMEKDMAEHCSASVYL